VFSILNTPSKVYKLAFGTFETSLNAPFGTFKTSLLQLGLWNIQNIEKMFWMFQTSLNPPSLPPSSFLWNIQNIKELILFVPKQLDHHLIITIGNFAIS
jgi:hypothetical protein